MVIPVWKKVQTCCLCKLHDLSKRTCMKSVSFLTCINTSNFYLLWLQITLKDIISISLNTADNVQCYLSSMEMLFVSLLEIHWNTFYLTLRRDIWIWHGYCNEISFFLLFSFEISSFIKLTITAQLATRIASFQLTICCGSRNDDQTSFAFRWYGNANSWFHRQPKPSTSNSQGKRKTVRVLKLESRENKISSS